MTIYAARAVNLKQRLWPDIDKDTWSDYRWQLRNRLTGRKGLSRLLRHAGQPERLESLEKCLSAYKWAATPYYISLIEKDIDRDPVALQVIPSPEEIGPACPHSSPDPLSEKRYSPFPGLIHRYQDRAVVLVSNHCASYCRHCNRKRTWNRPEFVPAGKTAWQAVTQYLENHSQIREVLVSGGDPLLLPQKYLENILDLLTSVPNVEVLRIGTRLPVVLPMAITDKLCRMLKKYRPIWINTHFNHPAEITKEAQRACERLQMSGIPLSNQSVLLKGINDDFKTIKSLCCNLQKIMVRPYYLFHCDFVKGTDHFRTDIRKGIDIMEKMWGDTGGMCIPRYVVDLPGGMGKARVMPSDLERLDQDVAIFKTFEGRVIKLRLS